MLLRQSQNLALNVAEKGFDISVFNRTYAKTEAAVTRAKKSGAYKLAKCASIDVRPKLASFTPHLVSSCVRSRKISRAAGLGEKLHGYEEMKDFVQSLEKPRCASVCH